MSAIRFVHTDFLRLASPISGVAAPPTWLLQLATAGVRHAVRNVIETALTQRADFLFIAGSICDSPEDLESAAHWLNEQFAPLRREGIRIVAVADDQRTSEALQRICDVVINRSESLHASTDAGGQIELTTNGRLGHAINELVITTDSRATLTQHQRGQLHYHASPSLRASDHHDQRSRQETLTRSAGAVQPINSTETGDYGCLVVDADFQQATLESSFVASNPIRFASEKLNLTELTSADRLVNEIAQASKSLQRASGQTVIVDWIVNAPMESDAHEVSNLFEHHLLGRLRNHLESGHQGVWPRKIRFRETASLQLACADSAAVEEYFDVVTGSVTTRESDGFRVTASLLRGSDGVSIEE